MEMGDRLRQLRKHLGMNQIDFAESLGLKQGSYSDLERGKSGLSNHVKMLLSEKYNVNIDWLVNGEGNMFTGEPKEVNSSSNIIILNINKLVDYSGLSKGKFADKVGINRSNFSKITNGNYPCGEGVINKIVLAFGVNKQWLLTGEGDMYTPRQINEVSYGDLIIMNVPLVSRYAYDDYLNNYLDDDYVNRLPKFPFSKGGEQGRYIAFEMEGDSMIDDTDRYVEGAILLCREIPKSLWGQITQYMKKWDFVIVHKEGILIKRVVDHDVENHRLTLHSLNPLYSNRVVDLVDVRQIFNVVKLQRGMQI